MKRKSIFSPNLKFVAVSKRASKTATLYVALSKGAFQSATDFKNHPITKFQPGGSDLAAVVIHVRN